MGGMTMQRIAESFGCEVGDLCRQMSGSAILQLLRDGKSAKISGGLYHEQQVRGACSSTHMGSRLTENQTGLLFETNMVDRGEGIPADDIAACPDDLMRAFFF